MLHSSSFVACAESHRVRGPGSLVTLPSCSTSYFFIRVGGFHGNVITGKEAAGPNLQEGCRLAPVPSLVKSMPQTATALVTALAAPWQRCYSSSGLGPSGAGQEGSRGETAREGAGERQARKREKTRYLDTKERGQPVLEAERRERFAIRFVPELCS